MATSNISTLRQGLAKQQIYWSGVAWVAEALTQRIEGIKDVDLVSVTEKLATFVSLPDAGLVKRSAAAFSGGNGAAAPAATSGTPRMLDLSWGLDFCQSRGCSQSCADLQPTWISLVSRSKSATLKAAFPISQRGMCHSHSSTLNGFASSIPDRDMHSTRRGHATAHHSLTSPFGPRLVGDMKIRLGSSFTRLSSALTSCSLISIPSPGPVRSATLPFSTLKTSGLVRYVYMSKPVLSCSVYSLSVTGRFHLPQWTFRTPRSSGTRRPVACTRRTRVRLRLSGCFGETLPSGQCGARAMSYALDVRHGQSPFSLTRPSPRFFDTR